MKSREFWIRVGLGFIVCLPVALILAGPSILGGFVISILCTFGIALIAYIFLFYAIGSIIRIPFSLSTEFINEQKNLTYKGKKLTHVQIAALSYIMKARQQGCTDNRILELMKKNGWSEDTIQTFFPKL